MAEFIPPIQRMIEEFRKLPGVGVKTAARYAFSVLNLTDEEAVRFADAIMGLSRDVHKCPVCFGLSEDPEKVELFSHFLDCEAHTDVWRELFKTWNHTNEI